MTIRQFAASLTAAALTEIFPKVTLLSVMPRRFGFSVEATVPGGISKEALTLIEERIPSIKSRPIKRLEMIGSNASTFLRHKHQMERASQVKNTPLVTLIQIGEFVDVCKTDFETEFDGYRLLELETNGDTVTLKGCAHPTKDQSKAFVKDYKKLKEGDHTAQFTITDQISYTPEQEALYFDLICKWRDWVKKHGGALYRGPQKPKGPWCATLAPTDGGEGIEGLLDTPCPTAGFTNAPQEAIDDGIASLGLKTTRDGATIYADDIYGTPWPIAEPGKFYTSIERTLALLLEQKNKP